MYSIVLFILDLVFQVFAKFTSFFFEPIFEFLKKIGIPFTDYLGTAQTFLNTYFYPYIKFSRDVIINVTGLPVGLFTLLSSILLLFLGIYISMLLVRFIINVFALVRTGRSIGKEFK